MSSESILFETPSVESNILKENELETDILFATNEDASIEPIEELETDSLTTVKKVELPPINNQSEIITDEVNNDAILFATEEDNTVEISNLDKLDYGWDKNQMVVGNAITLGSNLIEALFDPTKNFEEVSVQNEKERVEKFEKEHWYMLDGKNDGAYTAIGEAASFLLDPYYLAGYFYGAGFLASPLSSAVLNGALIGGDNLIEQLAKKGKVNKVELGQATVTGAAIGLVFPIGAKAIKKFLPNVLKSKVEEVTKFMDTKIAKANGVTPDELITIRTAAQTSTVQKITNQLDDLITADGFKTTSSNFASKLNQAEKGFLDLRSKLSKEAFDINKARKVSKDLISKLTPERKVTFGIGKSESVIKVTQAKIKEDGKKILGIRDQIKKAKEAYLILDGQQKARATARLNKYYKLEGERTAAILAELEKTAGVGSKFLRAVLANFTKPLVGAAGGAAANVGAGALGADVEDDIIGWTIAGALLGSGQKAIQKSIKIPLGQKDVYNKVIGNHAVRFTMQKLRELTAGTVATKLNSFGGTTQKISRLLFRQVDDTMSSKSVIAQADAMDTYFLRRANNIITNSTPEMQIQAMSINRGNIELEKIASKEVLDLAQNLKGFFDEINVQASKAGFFNPKELENYFPRVLNWEKINADRAGAEKIFTNIFKNNYKLTTEKAKKAASDYLTKSEGPGVSSVINQNAWKKIIQGSEKGVARNRNPLTGDEDLIFTPISDHITKQRALQGEFNIVEGILEREGFLINDLNIILPKIIKDSTKSIAFARTFGKGGSLLKPMLEQIKQKYDDLALTNNKLGLGSTRQGAAANETNLILDSVDAYFDRYGIKNVNSFKNSIGILTMMSNLNMLGRVTISSLGDIIQPFQNSRTWTAAIKGLGRTNLFKASWEKGLARSLGYDFTNEMSRSLAKTAASDGKDLMLSQAWMGKWGVPVTEKIKSLGKSAKTAEFYNNIAFKGLGLEWLTGYARRFAYNAGSADAYNLSRQYFKIVNGAKGSNSRAAKLLQKDLLETYEITANQALTIGAGSTFNNSIKNKTAKRFLNQAGLKGSNRDALIPQVDNRLLFTQSKDPRIRMLGQFMSWSQAKSAQTNKMLARIENGDARTLIKLVAAIPVFAGIQQLREYAKHGDVITDAEYNGGELVSKAWQLSGMPGWLSDLVFNRFVGPGSRNSPFFVFAPALNMATEIGNTIKDFATNKPDDAWKRIDKKLLPVPNWRNWVRKFWFGPSGVTTKKSTGSVIPSFKYGGIVRKKFNTGDLATSNMGYISAIKEIDTEQKTKPVLLNTEKVADDVPNQEIKVKEKIKIPMKKPKATKENTIVMINNDTLSEDVKKRIQKNEGFRDKVYKDHLGFDTIGTGHKLTKDDKFIKGKKYSKEELQSYYEKDLKIAMDNVDKLIDKDTTDPKAYGIMVEMAFQMGGNGLSKFKKTLEAVNRKDYKVASTEMMDSKWATQTPERATELSELMSSIFKEDK